jgi:CxxC-x17-CxxC domain-containing protein
MTLHCRDCGRDFLFTVGEQEFFQSRGLTNNPSRCPECRTARKQQQGGSGGGYGGGEGRSRREFFSAVCSNCGREARVPFQPRGDRPVYCSECYQQMNAGGGAARY